ncbi:MAG: esterase-like activity of phytase family protein [Brevundimonas sp.]|uniref:esterase-like activity of phytase family protein n=1 Tax=Brevundimonas sp. TaxID=1871086 RepID=UPI0027346416|nr:esterase-like activity of phytase family protein [Brevundimonas sp.]MDP3406006.1 esterase-like activity of phytase family protein [Brevundimonas sp.]
MKRAVLRILGALTLMGAAACAAVATSTPGPLPGLDRAIRMEARHVPLGLGGATLAPGVRYAGGLILRGPGLHGLSDLKIESSTADDANAWVVSDFGDLIRFTLRLDRNGRLTSADTAISRPLTGPDGTILTPKPNADAEGLAILPNGEVLVSFERDHRIWSYGVGAGERPVAVAAPAVALPDNEGLEALAAAGPTGWLALAEGGGAWLCAIDCVPMGRSPLIPADDYRFTGADRDPAGDGWFVVERFYRPPLDMRVRVRRLSAEGVLSAPLIQLRPPASVDNFEGIAAVATPTGTRLYLLSDDNANPLQKTLLLAFDTPG